ncbi:MAG: ZIP family metal transporter [Porphyrobacter sp. IPPAS B-1204]|nr:MAG: ZIP family metal transporter [Porphyrobacter sp. IPPAS B-1204]
MAEAAVIGVAASLLAGAMTGVGGWLVGLLGAPDERRHNLLVGFAAGVMIAAAFFSLIMPAIAQAQLGGASLLVAVAGVALAVWLGALATARLGRGIEALAVRGLLPARLAIWPSNIETQRIALFVMAMTLHNLPEGTAVGLSFMSGDPQIGWATAIGIGIQNIPEGMAVAALLATLGWSHARCALAALATGLVEPLGAAIGVAVVQASTALLPWVLGLSAGAMLFVAIAEMIPHARRRIEHGSATPALMAGLVVMMFLDLSLG